MRLPVKYRSELVKNDKREEYISWDSYFIGLAAMASFRSKDPSTQNGACIVDPVSNSPLSLGYNGFPRGCSDDKFPWAREAKDKYNTKYPYVEHAERNAIFNAARKGVGLDGASIYIYSEKGYYPCDECARAIIQSGIRRVIMPFAIKENTDKYDWAATKEMFRSSQISITVLNEEIIMGHTYSDKLFLDFELMSAKMKEISEKINRKNKKEIV